MTGPPQVNSLSLHLVTKSPVRSEQLDSLVLTFEETASGIAEASWPEVTAKAEIAKLFTELVQDGKIPTEVAPKDWSRFSDNLYSLLQACPGWPRQRGDRPGFVMESLGWLKEQIDQLDSTRFPRSISLHQLVIGILSDLGRVKSPLTRFTPIITDELKTFYPSVGELNERFIFE
jgi:hypothetical protein